MHDAEFARQPCVTVAAVWTNQLRINFDGNRFLPGVFGLEPKPDPAYNIMYFDEVPIGYRDPQVADYPEKIDCMTVACSDGNVFMFVDPAVKTPFFALYSDPMRSMMSRDRIDSERGLGAWRCFKAGRESPGCEHEYRDLRPDGTLVYVTLSYAWARAVTPGDAVTWTYAFTAMSHTWLGSETVSNGRYAIPATPPDPADPVQWIDCPFARDFVDEWARLRTVLTGRFIAGDCTAEMVRQLLAEA